MKTIEEKAKAYDEALERANNFIENGDEYEKTVAESIFAGLRESEDERINKAIFKALSKKEARDVLLAEGVQVSDALAYLEKQKDASKAIEAVDRIDKYIDEHLANAHDMKDSNPDKKYYRGWDDALGKMAGILQDVYSDEKQKEQNPHRFCDDTLKAIDKAREFDEQEQKPAWSEEDESILNNIIAYRYLNVDDLEWIKKLPKRFNLQPKQEWSEEDENKIESIKGLITMGRFADTNTIRTIWELLDSLRPSWKPSEEHLSALLAIFNDPDNIGSQTCQLALTDLYEHLKKL